MEHMIEQIFYNSFVIYIEKFLVILSIAISFYKIITVIAYRIKGSKKVLSIKIYVISMVLLLTYQAIHFKLFLDLDIWFILGILAMTISLVVYQCFLKSYHKLLPVLISLICYFYVFLGVETDNITFFLLNDFILLLPLLIRLAMIFKIELLKNNLEKH